MGDPKDHLANERTFLAWIRTNLGIMAFGFIFERFSLLLQQIGIMLGKSEVTESTSRAEYASIFGLFLIGVGSLFCIFAFLKYKKTQNQIQGGIYQSSNVLDLLLALLVFVIGVVLIVYLLR